MSNKMKYIMFEDGHFFFVPLHMNHSDLVPKHRFGDVHSAGFVQFYHTKGEYGEDAIKVHCFGHSQTLCKECDKAFDETRINISLRLD